MQAAVIPNSHRPNSTVELRRVGRCELAVGVGGLPVDGDNFTSTVVVLLLPVDDLDAQSCYLVLAFFALRRLHVHLRRQRLHTHTRARRKFLDVPNLLVYRTTTVLDQGSRSDRPIDSTPTPTSSMSACRSARLQSRGSDVSARIIARKSVSVSASWNAGFTTPTRAGLRRFRWLAQPLTCR